MPRINPRKIARMKRAGIRTVERSAERDEAIRAKHAAQQGEEHYLRFGLREDAEGNLRGHSGTPVFGFDRKGIKHEAINLVNVHNDLQNAGYTLTGVHVLLKPRTDEDPDKPRMGALVLTYEAVPEDEVEVKQVVLTREQLQLIGNELDRFFSFVHIWDNREADGSACVNPSHVVEDKDERLLTDPRLLRFAVENGKPKWINESGLERAQQSASA